MVRQQIRKPNGTIQSLNQNNADAQFTFQYIFPAITETQDVMTAKVAHISHPILRASFSPSMKSCWKRESELSFDICASELIHRWHPQHTRAIPV